MTKHPSASEILQGNLDLHQVEAPYYDLLHPEIFNRYEQHLVLQDLTNIWMGLGRTPLRVLDIGCGTGNLTLKFLHAGHYVDGVDISSEMLEILHKKQPENDHLQLFAMDADTFLATNREYDVICISSVMHHLPDYKATLAYCARSLRPDGVVYVAHEPLPRIERSRPAPIQNALTWLGWKVWGAWWRWLKRIQAPRLDYTLSDVHVEEGISPEDLLDILRAFSMEPMFIRRYRAEPLAMVAWLNNGWFRSRPQLFTLVARKTIQ